MKQDRTTGSLRHPTGGMLPRDLPAGAPSSFSGAVGDFSLEMLAPPAQVAATPYFQPNCPA